MHYLNTVTHADYGVQKYAKFELPEFKVIKPNFTSGDWYTLVGRSPVGDDLDRLNCEEAGLPGHLTCGMCGYHELPRSVCGCVALCGAKDADLPLVEVKPMLNDPCALFLDNERIWGLNLFEVADFLSVLEPFVGYMMKPEVFEEVRYRVKDFLMELRRIDALYRDYSKNFWTYRKVL